jgi:predicted enzyme related to lactoylglutathione lyase
MPSSRLTYVAPVFQVADLQASLVCRVHLNGAVIAPRDQQAFERADHLDACFGVADAKALFAEFQQRGAAFSVELRTMPYGREFYARDPDGYILGFVQPEEAR